MSDTLDFDVTSVPDEFPGNGPEIASDDLTCEVCGTALTYAGRGRKPRFCDEHKRSGSTGNATPRRSGGKDVETACAALHGLYEGLLFPLAGVNMTAAKAWEKQINQLDQRNQIILSGDPALARKIVQSAAKGGGTALVLSHVIAVGPVVAILVGDLRARRAAAKPAPEPAYAASPNGSVYDETMPFP